MNGAVLQTNGVREYQAVAGQTNTFFNFGETDTHVSPIETHGEAVYFKPEAMRPNQPYPFEFLGEPIIAVRRDDGTIDFYSLP